MDKVYVVSETIPDEGLYIREIFQTKELAEEYISLCEELQTECFYNLDCEEVKVAQNNDLLCKLKQQRENYKEFKGFEVVISRKGILSCEEYDIRKQYYFDRCLYKTFLDFPSRKSVLCLARNKKEAKAIALEVYKEKK